MDSLLLENLQDFSTNYISGRTTDENIDFLRQAMERLEKEPVAATYSYLGKDFPVVLDTSFLFQALMTFGIMAYYPNALGYLMDTLEVHLLSPAKAIDNFSRLATFILDPEDGTTEAMYQAIICREFPEGKLMVNELFKTWKTLPSIYTEEMRTDMEKYGDMGSSCYLNIPASYPEKIIKKPVTSDVPILVVGGEIDHVTSPAYVRQVSVNFSNAEKHVFEGTGHGVFSDKECISESVLDYLVDGNFKNKCK